MNGLDRIRLVETNTPEVIRLARLVSLAARVEPSLIRRARLLHFPFGSAVLEAQLWFAPIVRTRDTQWITFYPDVAAILRGQLRTAGELDAAWELVMATHPGKPELTRRFEELLFHSLRDLPLESYNRAAELILGTVLSGLRNPGREVLARWAFTVCNHIRPRSAGDAVQLMRDRACNYLYGQVPDARALPPGAGRVVFEGTATLSVGIRLVKGDLEFSDPPAPKSMKIEIPDVLPRAVQVSWWVSGRFRAQWLEWNRVTAGHCIVRGVTTPVVIETLRGERFEIRERYAVKAPTPRLDYRPAVRELEILIDREAQVASFEVSYSQLQESRRPVLCIIHGDRDQWHDALLARLTRLTLPRLVRASEREFIGEPVSVDFPPRSKNDDFRQSIVREFSRLLDRAPGSEQDLIRELTPPGRITMVAVRLRSQDKAGQLLEFCRFWDSWPELPSKTSLLVWLLVIYDPPKPGIFAKLSQEQRNRRLRNEVKRVEDEMHGAIVLPSLSSVSLHDLLAWHDQYVEPLARRSDGTDWANQAIGEKDQISMDKAMSAAQKLIEDLNLRALL
jgi:hypothetical protein